MTEYAKCSECGRAIAVFVCKGGDGTGVRLRNHGKRGPYTPLGCGGRLYVLGVEDCHSTRAEAERQG